MGLRPPAGGARPKCASQQHKCRWQCHQGTTIYVVRGCGGRYVISKILLPPSVCAFDIALLGFASIIVCPFSKVGYVAVAVVPFAPALALALGVVFALALAFAFGLGLGR